MKNRKGFTLIELLLVMVIIAILMSIVLIAINPARQISQANDKQRSSDVNAILNGVWQYSLDNAGAKPINVSLDPDAPVADGTVATQIGSAATDINICASLVPTYLAAMPFDPTDADASYTDCTSYDTGYTMATTADGRVTIAAPGGEIDTNITVTR